MYSQQGKNLNEETLNEYFQNVGIIEPIEVKGNNPRLERDSYSSWHN